MNSILYAGWTGNPKRTAVDSTAFFIKICNSTIRSTMIKIPVTLLRTHGKAPGNSISFAVGTIVVSRLYTIVLGRLHNCSALVVMRVKLNLDRLSPYTHDVYGLYSYPDWR